MHLLEQMERLFSILVHARVRGRDSKKEVFQVFQVFQGVQGSLGGGVYGGMIVAIGAKSYTNCVFSYKKFGNWEKM